MMRKQAKSLIVIRVQALAYLFFQSSENVMKLPSPNDSRMQSLVQTDSNFLKKL